MIVTAAIARVRNDQLELLFAGKVDAEFPGRISAGQGAGIIKFLSVGVDLKTYRTPVTYLVINADSSSQTGANLTQGVDHYRIGVNTQTARVTCPVDR